MRFQAVIFVSFCLTLSAWSQLTYTVPIIDKSDPGSPFSISGTASFTELIAGSSVTTFGTFKVEARNVSERSILLLFAYFDEAGPHGGETHHVIQIDHFFWGEIAPGESFVLARGRARKRTSVLSRNSVGPAADPQAEIRVRYVQFVDGSAFGDKTAAKEMLELRPVILNALQRLDKAGNQEEFLALLTQKFQPDAADRFLETFRHTEKHQGTALARAQVRRGLTVAEGRAPAMRTVRAAKWAAPR